MRTRKAAFIETGRPLLAAWAVLAVLASGGAAAGAGPGALAHFIQPSGLATDSAGDIFVADTGSWTIRKINPAGTVSTFAGKATERRNVDGPGGKARFNHPDGVAIDSAGNLYVADSQSNTIRKITPTGLVSTLAGKAGEDGSNDGEGAVARFGAPFGPATDSAGNLYVADGSNHTIRRITPAGVVSTIAGKAGEKCNVDGAGVAARFSWPSDIAIDSAGNLYVSEYSSRIIRKITPTGVVSTFAGKAGEAGSSDGEAAVARYGGQAV